MKKFVLLTTAGLLLNLQIDLAGAASLSAGQRAFEAGDYATALTELAPLAQEGDAEALNLLGQIYEQGLGVPADPQQAQQLYERGARQGHLGSVNSLRALKNKAYSAEFAKVMPDAEAGNASAQNRIGEMYEFGQGVKRDTTAAFQWYSKAAEQDLISAWHNLGRCYNFGTGVKQDYAAAEEWYRKAASQGYRDSMFFLGTLYATNHGRDTSAHSDVIAYAWMKNAALAGNSTAVTISGRLKMKLDDAQQAAADALVEEYKAQYVTPFQSN